MAVPVSDANVVEEEPALDRVRPALRVLLRAVAMLFETDVGMPVIVRFWETND